jgi:hypothetical protein
MLAKGRSDLMFERPTAYAGPIEDDGPGTPTTALNSDGLWFLVGK